MTMAGDMMREPSSPLKLAPPPHCPLVHVADVVPCDPEELDSVIGWMQSGTALAQETRFARGTALPDGRLDMCKQSLGPQGAARVMRALSYQPHIHHLLLGTDGLGDEGATEVAEHLRQPNHLQTVYLGCNAIGAEGASALAQACGTSSQLKGLWLKRNPLGPDAVPALVDMLRQNPNLEMLDLHNTGLGDDGCAALLRALPHSSLHRLYLGANGAGPQSAKALCHLLASGEGPRDLFLGTNPLGDAGVVELAKGLRKQNLRSPRILALPAVQVGDEGVRALVETLGPGRKGLEMLDLGRTLSSRALEIPPNKITVHGVKDLAGWLSTNPALRVLHLEGNPLRTSALLALERALETNHTLTHLKMGKNMARKTMRRVKIRLEENSSGQEVLDLYRETWAIRSVYR